MRIEDAYQVNDTHRRVVSYYRVISERTTDNELVAAVLALAFVVADVADAIRYHG